LACIREKKNNEDKVKYIVVGLDSIKDIVRKFFGSSDYDKAVDEFIRELQKSLILADVNVSIVVKLSDSIRKRLKEEEPPSILERREWFIKIVYEELVKIFSGSGDLNVYPQKLPYIIMLIGVQGSGKTTSAGKLAYFYRRKQYKVALVWADIYRPASRDQLEQIGRSINVKVYGDPSLKDVIKIAKEGVNKAIEEGAQVIIIDTAGRHGFGQENYLLEEMRSLSNEIKPDEIMLVIDASIGQKAKDLALSFSKFTDIGSIFITKFDGTAKGGGALSAAAVTGARIKFIGNGEKIEDIEVLDPKRFVSRLLGMGDIEGILEKFKEAEEFKDMEKKMEDVISGKAELTLRDIYRQIKALRKMGPLSKIISSLPGFSMLPRNLSDSEVKLTEEKMKKWLSIMDSMTYEELDRPYIINKERIRRISMGSGSKPEEVKELLNYYNALNTLIKNVRRKKIDKLFGSKINPR
jgi:signal recognition particle subunit SRP54